MAKRKNIVLQRKSSNCEQVSIPSLHTRYANPIGSVCKVDGGYEYTSFPVLHVHRGPVKTKAIAVLKVLNDYKSWIG